MYVFVGRRGEGGGGGSTQTNIVCLKQNAGNWRRPLNLFFVVVAFTRFLKVPELPGSQYSDSIVNHFGFATSLISTKPSWTCSFYDRWRVKVHFPFFENTSRHSLMSIKLDIISQVVRSCFANNQHSMRFQDLIRCPVVFAGTQYSFQLPGEDSDSINQDSFQPYY